MQWLFWNLSYARACYLPMVNWKLKRILHNEFPNHITSQKWVSNSDISKAVFCRGSTLHFQRSVTHRYTAPAITSCFQKARVANALPADRQMFLTTAGLETQTSCTLMAFINSKCTTACYILWKKKLNCSFNLITSTQLHSWGVINNNKLPSIISIQSL